MGRSIDASELGRRIRQGDRLALARLLSLIESGDRAALECAFEIPVADDAQVVGVCDDSKGGVVARFPSEDFPATDAGRWRHGK